MSPLDRLKRLRDAVLAGGARRNDSAEMKDYLEKVANRAATITGEEVASLLAHGHEQDEIFETTVATALGAAIERFEAGMRALDAAASAKEPPR